MIYINKKENEVQKAMKKIGQLKVFPSREVDLSSGVSIGFECLDRDLFKAECCYEPLAASGIKYARVQTGWNKCETQKGVYDWSWLDNIVNNLLERGVQPWFNVGFGNPIYMGHLPQNPTCVGCVPIYYGEETLTAWKNFTRALAEHYKDRVQHYEIWNEPEIKPFWFPKEPDGVEYAKLIQLTAKEIRTAFPEAKIGGVMAGALDNVFFPAMMQQLNPGDIDFLCYHIYTAVPEYRHAATIGHLRRGLKARGMDNVEIWQGEGGYPSWAYEGHWLVKEGCNDERPQAIYQLRRYFLDMAFGVRMSSFFQIADMWEKPYAKANEVLAKPAAQGILNGLTYTPKQSYYTISHLAAIFSFGVKAADIHMLVDSEDPDVINLLAIQKLTFEKQGSPIYAYYLPTPITERAENPYAATVITDKRIENPVLIDTFTGDVFEAAAPEQDHKGMYCYKGLPMKDYPLMLTDRKTFAICGMV